MGCPASHPSRSIYTYKRVVCVCLSAFYRPHDICPLCGAASEWPREQEPSRAAPRAARASMHLREHARACRTTSQRVYVTAEIFKKREKENQHATSQVQYSLPSVKCLLFDLWWEPTLVRMLAGRHLPVRSMTLCFGRRHEGCCSAAAEKNLLRELVDSKQDVIEKMEALLKKTEEQQDSTARELLQTVARHRAVIVNRVLLDSCLRGNRVYDAKQTFTQRYRQFVTTEVMGEDGRFTLVADRIMKKIPDRYQVKGSDIKKELDGLPHHYSKPFHFLQEGIDAGLHVGGDMVTTATMSLLIAVLQQKQMLDESVKATNERGQYLYTIINGNFSTAPLVDNACFLQDGTDAGLYVGGDMVTTATMSLLIAVLQRKQLLEGSVKATNERGQYLYTIVHGHFRNQVVV